VAGGNNDKELQQVDCVFVSGLFHTCISRLLIILLGVVLFFFFFSTELFFLRVLVFVLMRVHAWVIIFK
jgi:hypothetical protein